MATPSVFAIESAITRAYDRLSLRALGYFTLHIGGRRFGVCEPDATLLACALDSIAKRLAGRGTHTALFSHAPAGEIIDAILEAIYRPEPKSNLFFGLSVNEFSDLVHVSRCEWHPDFDEAFDDGSSVRQFDVGDQVRIIADRNRKQPFDWRYDETSLTDIWMPAVTFYKVLQDWHDAFLAEWQRTTKIPISEDGAESY